MKKLLFGLLFLTGSLFAADFQLNVVDFTGGLRTDIDSSRIADNEVADVENVLFDEDASAKTRAGMVKSNSVALGGTADRNIYSQFEYRRSDGSSYHIIHSSTSLYYSLNSSDFTSFSSTASASYEMNYTVFMDTLTYCNGVIGICGWDTNTAWTHTDTYKPKYITTFQNRLVIGGDPAEPANVRFSAFQDPRDWTTGTELATGSNVFSINSQDGQNVVGFFKSPNGNLGILKDKSVWEIGGYDSSDFYQRLVIADIGCVDSGSVAYKEGVVYWLSSEGYVGYNGTSYSIVSDNIDTIIDGIQQSNLLTGSFSKSTTEDWQNYASTECVNVSNGKLYYNMPSTTTLSTLGSSSFVENGNDFHIVLGDPARYMVYNTTSTTFHTLQTLDGGNAGNLRSNFMTKIGSVLYTALCNNGEYNSNVYISSRTIGTDTVWHSEAYKVAAFDSPYSASIDGYYMTFLRKYYSANQKYAMVVSSFNTTTGSWKNPPVELFLDSTYGISGEGFKGASMCKSSETLHMASGYVDSINGGGGTIYFDSQVVYSSCATPSLTSATTKQIDYNRKTSPTQPNEYYVLSISTDSNNYAHILYTSEEDVALKHAYFDGSSWADEDIKDLTAQTVSKYTGNIYIDSSDSIYILHGYPDATGSIELGTKSTGGSWVDITVSEQELNYGVPYLSKNSDDNLVSSFFGLDNKFYLLTGCTASYESNIYDTGYTSSTIYSNVVDYNEGRANTYHYYRSSDSVANVSGETYAEFTPNAAIAADISKHLQYKVVLSTNTLNNINDIPYVNSVILNYKGITGSSKLSSMFYDGRIWNGVSYNRTDILDKTLVFDRNKVWTQFSSDVETMNYLNLNGTPYMGSTDGYIYRLDTTDSDAGNAINAYVLTKAFDIGTIIGEKSMETLFLVALYTGNWELNLDYYLNKSLTATETFAVNMALNDLINYKVPLKQRPRFYTIQYKIYNDAVGEPFSFMGLYSTLKGYPLR